MQAEGWQSGCMCAGAVPAAMGVGVAGLGWLGYQGAGGARRRAGGELGMGCAARQGLGAVLEPRRVAAASGGVRRAVLPPGLRLAQGCLGHDAQGLAACWPAAGEAGARESSAV